MRTCYPLPSLYRRRRCLKTPRPYLSDTIWSRDEILTLARTGIRPLRETPERAAMLGYDWAERQIDVAREIVKGCYGDLVATVDAAIEAGLTLAILPSDRHYALVIREAGSGICDAIARARYAQIGTLTDGYGVAPWRLAVKRQRRYDAPTEGEQIRVCRPTTPYPPPKPEPRPVWARPGWLSEPYYRAYYRAYGRGYVGDDW